MEITYNSWPDLSRTVDVTVVAPDLRSARRRVQPLSQSIDFRYEASKPSARSVDPRVYGRSGSVMSSGQQPTGTLLDARA